MKRILALLLGLILVMSVFVACSNTTDTTDTTDDTEQGTPDNGPNNDDNSGNDTNNENKVNIEGTWETTMSLYDLTNDGLIINLESEDEEDSSDATDATDTTDTTEPTDAADATDDTAADGSEEPESGDVNATLSELALNTYLTYRITFTGDSYTITVNQDEFNAAANAMADAFVENLKVIAASEGMTYEDYLERNDLTEESYRSDVIAALGNPTESGKWTMDGNTLYLGKNAYMFTLESDTEFTLYAEEIYFYYSKV